MTNDDVKAIEAALACFPRFASASEYSAARFALGERCSPDVMRRLLDERAQMLEALRAARECIRTDRTALADTYMGPDNTLDEDGAAGCAEYDAVLAQISAALARAEGGE